VVGRECTIRESEPKYVAVDVFSDCKRAIVWELRAGSVCGALWEFDECIAGLFHMGGSVVGVLSVVGGSFDGGGMVISITILLLNSIKHSHL
jgi:hypothetical protein